MISEIEEMPNEARLWIYQANRQLNSHEQHIISQHLTSFLNGWAAHGNNLKAAFTIEFNQFIVIMVDERFAGASGCSIDSSVGMMRQLELQFDISLLDRSKIAYFDNEVVKLAPLNEVKGLIQSGAIREDTIIANNAVNTYGDWKSSWKQPAKVSWMSRYF
jgi:hypothetical protein